MKRPNRFLIDVTNFVLNALLFVRIVIFADQQVKFLPQPSHVFPVQYGAPECLSGLLIINHTIRTLKFLFFSICGFHICLLKGLDA